MFSIENVVWAVIYLLGCGLIFALLFFLINYVAKQFPGIEPFAKFARILLVVLMVLVLIGFVLSMMGHPILRWHTVSMIQATTGHPLARFGY